MRASVKYASIIASLFWSLMLVIGASIFYGAATAHVPGFPSLAAAMSYMGWPLLLLLANVLCIRVISLPIWVFWIFMFLQALFGLYSFLTLGGGI